MLLELQKEVEQRLNNISSNLQNFKSQQKLLQENADKIKSNINDETDVHINLLKRKEKQLIRQVDFITAHQKSLIDSHIANSLQAQGSLLTVQGILSRCSPEDECTLLKIKDSVYTNESSPAAPMKMICVQLETTPLANAIDNFGKAHFPDSIMHHHSSVVPAKIEDYGDCDQVVLHKSLDSNYGTCDSVADINVRFPKDFPIISWLASSQKKDSSFAKPIGSRMNKDLSCWLAENHSQRNNVDGLFQEKISLDEDQEDTFQFLDFTSSSSQENGKGICSRSCGSSSIEIVNSIGSEKDFSLLSDSPNATKVLNNGILKPDIVCQANEPCSSYSECVCNGYCESLALEKAAQTSKWLAKNHFGKTEGPNRTRSKVGQKRKFHEARDQVINQMIKILASESKMWLAAPFHKDTIDSTGCLSSSKILYKTPSNSYWLERNRTKSEVKETTIPHTTCFKPWLLHHLKEEKDNKNIENKNCSYDLKDVKEAIEEINDGINYPPYKKMFLSNSNTDTQNLSKSEGSRNLSKSIIKHKETDIERKLKWLLSTSLKCSDNHGVVFPKSFNALNNFDQWLNKNP